MSTLAAIEGQLCSGSRRHSRGFDISMTNDAVLIEIEKGVAAIRFNRPERLNALSMEVACGFADAIDSVLADSSVRVITVSGAGRAFLAGGDLAHFRGAADRGAAAAELIDPIHSALKKLAAAPPITIAVLHGAVVGAGMSIAMGLDLAIAADTTVMNVAYGKVAASPDCGGSWALVRHVGLRRAMEMALLSDDIPAEQALALGLVSKVVAAADLQTDKLTARLLAGGSFANGQIKKLMRGALDHDYHDQLALEAASFAACARTDDFAEAVTAFLDKRRPVFGSPAG